MQLVCSECHDQVPFGTMGRCPACKGILRLDYSDEVVNQLAEIQPGRGIDRYRAILPVSTPLPTLGEGDTPLLPSRRLGPALGLKQLYFKVEGANPSGAFKDRGATLAAALAREAGVEGILTASSGNAAAAISAYAAAAGLKCLILLEPGNPPAKLRQAVATGAQVLPVAGIFAHGPDALGELIFKTAARLNYYPAFIWAPVNPYILEGIKTISYEIAAHLPGPPDVVICPVGGGDMLTAQWRGYLELKKAGVIERLPRLIGVQSLSAPPLLEAFRRGATHVDPLPYANSKISGINVPFSGDHVLAALRESEGLAVGVSDDMVFAMQRRLAVEEGVWVEPAAAATLAALGELFAQDQLQPDERIVCIFSGAGFKDTHLAETEAQVIGQREPVAFDGAAIVAQDVFTFN
jgi:threonine synthase